MFFYLVWVLKCYGWKGESVWRIYPPPTDFDFHLKAMCIWKDQTAHDGDSDMTIFTSILTSDVPINTAVI